MDLVRDKRPGYFDRVLGGSFLASLIINVLLVILLGNSHLFDTPSAPRLVTIKTIRPPLLQKKPPHPPKPPPPPPQKPVVVKTPVIHPPTPQVSRPTYVPHVATVASTAPTAVAVQSTPVVAPVAQPTAPTEVNTPVAPAAPPPVAPPAAAPGPPAPAAPPAPPTPPAPPPPVRVAIPDRAEPECLTPFPSDISNAVTYDPNALLATTVTLTFTVDTDGSVTHISFDQRTGNDDLDDYLTKLVQNSRWKPAVQDGEPRAVKFSHTFELQ